jgi:hypothetical protein
MRHATALMTGVCALFVAGTAMIGIASHAKWLLTTRDPVFVWGRSSTHRAEDSGSTLRSSIGYGLEDYEAANSTLPPGCTMDSNGDVLHGCVTLLLPYMQARFLYEQIDLARPWNDPANREPLSQEVPNLIAPWSSAYGDRDSNGLAVTDYASNVYVIGGTRTMRSQDITDGTSHTFIVGEAAGNLRAWGHPAGWRDARLGLNRSPDGFGSPQRSVVAFLMADGSVKLLNDEISPAVSKHWPRPTAARRCRSRNRRGDACAARLELPPAFCSRVLRSRV